MTKDQVATLKAVLEQKLDELHTNLRREEPDQETPALADINDQASIEIERTCAMKLKDRDWKLAVRVQDALERLAEGTYGNCESCEEPIGYKRLLARPGTTLCIGCKTEIESEEKQKKALSPVGDMSLVA